MGLHAVSEFLRKKHGELLHKEHISLFSHQRVYLDIASYIYKSVCTNGSKSSKWFNSLIKLITMFRENWVHVIPVFDGRAPPEKLAEQTDRREKRQKSRERLTLISQSIDAYQAGDRSQPIMTLLHEEIKGLQKKGADVTSLLKRKPKEEDVDSLPKSFSQVQLAELSKLCQSLTRQTSYITETDVKFMQQMFTACGVTWIQAPEEAEAYCCWLVKQGLGSAVISCDTDCIAHRADIIIFELDVIKGDITYVNLVELMEAWQLTDAQVVDFAILVGCDYNPGSRVNKIGPVRAVDLLQTYGCIEKIPNLTDLEVLHIDTCRRLFNPTYDTNVVIETITPNEDLLYTTAKERPDVDMETCLKCIKLNSTAPQILLVD